jgi:type IV secretion system protein VirB6
MDFTGHVFTTMFDALDSALASIVGRYAAVIDIVGPALRTGIIIYISLLGYAIMRGAVQYPFREYVYRGCQLAFLYFAVTSLYGAQIGMFAVGGLPSQFAVALGGADVSGLGGFYDKLAGTGFETASTMRKIASTYQETQGTLPDIGYAVFSGILVVLVMVATLLCAAIGFVIAVFGLFALALLAVVGPLFVAALLFEPTRGYFFAWLGACINFLMLIVFALVLTSFLTHVGESVLTTISDNDEIAGVLRSRLLLFPPNTEPCRFTRRRRSRSRQSVRIGSCGCRRLRCGPRARGGPRWRTRSRARYCPQSGSLPWIRLIQPGTVLRDNQCSAIYI